MRLAFLIALLFLPRLSFAQATNDTNAPALPAPPASAGGNAKPAAAPNKSAKPTTTAQMQATIDQLTQSNRDLLDFLKKQQAVLQDIQFDRRLQSRQIQSLEERLEDALSRKMRSCKARLPRSKPMPPCVPPRLATSAEFAHRPLRSRLNTSPMPTPARRPVADATPAARDLPAPARIGGRARNQIVAPAFHAERRRQQTDRSVPYPRPDVAGALAQPGQTDGKVYANTSALFINAFPKDDTIPQKVCAKLGSGGDSTELQGPGNYYLKIEASGGYGNWPWKISAEHCHKVNVLGSYFLIAPRKEAIIINET